MTINKQKHSIRMSLILLSIIALLSISACSPHPGAGTWYTDDNNQFKISKIIIVFEGTADFFSDKKENKTENAIRRCFWSASAENQMQMQCVHADNTDIKETYQFIVTETGHARLTQNEQLIALFQKQAL